MLTGIESSLLQAQDRLLLDLVDEHDYREAQKEVDRLTFLIRLYGAQFDFIAALKRGVVLNAMDALDRVRKLRDACGIDQLPITTEAVREATKGWGRLGFQAMLDRKEAVR